MIIENIIFPFDYIIIILISIISFFYFLKGLIQSILSLLTWIGSILISIYTYNTLAIFIEKQILQINFFQNYEYLTGIFSIIISIPIIFLLSLFILKRIRKFLSSDLDRQILGLILDKFFGLIFGVIFSYLIISAIIIILDRYKFNGLNIWLKENSNIINEINTLNNDYIYFSNNIEKINDN